jgi:thiamine biosynthesis lipoprotein ApbE
LVFIGGTIAMPLKFPPFKSPFRHSPRLKTHAAYFEGVLGTSLEIQCISSLDKSGSLAEKAILDEIDRLEAIFNAYNPSSELCRWQNSFEKEVSVSPELAQVLEDAENWRQQTCGAFNPAVEAFTRIWKTSEKEGREVSRHQLAVVGVHSRQPLWEIDRERGTARRLTRLPVTLNSIAKGFIIDCAAQTGYAVEGIEEILINIGGDIRHCGSKKAIIAIADPRNDAENAAPAVRIGLENQGVATSGNYRRGFRIGDHWFSHLLDPRSGWPVETAIGVSVLAPCAATADVLATVFSVLNPDESLQLAESIPAIGVFLITEKGERFSNSRWETQAQSD